VGSDKAVHIADKHVDVDVSAVPNISLCSNAANINDPSPVIAQSLGSSQSCAAAAGIPVTSSHYTSAPGSTSLLAAAVSAGDLASGTTRSVLALTN